MNTIENKDLAWIKLIYMGEPEVFSLLQIALKHDPVIVAKAISLVNPSGHNDQDGWDRVIVSLHEYGREEMANDNNRLPWYIEWLDTHYPELKAYDYDGDGFYHGEDTVFGINAPGGCRFNGISCVSLG